MLTPDQLEARKGKITSSIAAACLGLHPLITPLQAKARILGTDGFMGNKATERGNLLEDIILEYPSEVKNVDNFRAPFRAHPTHVWSADSCDALYKRCVDDKRWDLVAIGEGKTVAMGLAGEYGEEGTDQVPAHVLVQCHWHLIHWPEVDICYVPVLVGGYEFEFRLYEVHRDIEVEQRLLESLGKWHHEHIVLDKEPAAMAGDLDYLKERYPSNIRSLEQVDLGSELDVMVQSYVQLKEEAKLAKNREDAARARLQMIIKDRDGFESEAWKMTYKNNKPSERTDYEHLAKGLLDLHYTLEQKNQMLCKYAKVVQGVRTLRVTLKGLK